MGLLSEAAAGFFQSETTTDVAVKSHSSAGPVQIPFKRMGSLKNTSKDTQLELMFATKAGLPIPHFPVTHSAIAFRSSDDDYAVYGRQSPFAPSQWVRSGFKFYTKVDNEKPYLMGGYGFTAYPTGVFFNKKEISDILNTADKLINQSQSCNMIQSNCYSFSVTVMSLAIEKLLARPKFDAIDVSKILAVMEEHPLSDHHSIGVLNNGTVVDKLDGVLSLAETKLRNLKGSDKENELLDRISSLRTKISSFISWSLPYPMVGF